MDRYVRSSRWSTGGQLMPLPANVIGPDPTLLVCKSPSPSAQLDATACPAAVAGDAEWLEALRVRRNDASSRIDQVVTCLSTILQQTCKGAAAVPEIDLQDIRAVMQHNCELQVALCEAETKINEQQAQYDSCETELQVHPSVPSAV